MMSFFRAFSSVVFAACLFSVAVFGQIPTLPESWNAILNYPIAGGGAEMLWVHDANGDQHRDIVFVCGLDVCVYDGTDGSFIRTVSVGMSLSEFVFEVKEGDDWNGDGNSDLLIQRQHPSGSIRVDIVDPLSGILIGSLPDAVLPGGVTFGLANFDFLDDLNGDGYRELVVSHPAIGNQGVVAIYCPVTGACIEHWAGGFAGRGFGAKLQSLNDTDGDGLRDFVIMEAYEVGHVGPIVGALEVFASSGGWHISHTVVPPPGEVISIVLRQAHDFDNDGVDEFVSNYLSGNVALISPSSGQVVGTISNPLTQPQGFGVEVQGGGDFDGDGVDDLFIGAPAFLIGGYTVGASFVFSGKNLAPIGFDHGFMVAGTTGVLIAVMDGDSGDGFAKFVVAGGGTNVGLISSAAIKCYGGFAPFDDSYRRGTVVAADGSVGQDVLGFTEFGVGAPDFGGASRTVRIDSGVFSTVWLAKPPAALGFSRHVIFGRIGPELVLPSYALPAGIGDFAFPPTGLSPDPNVVTLTDLFSPNSGLLPSTFAAADPGSVVCVLPNNLPAGLTFTLQGIVEDPASSSFGISITNSVRVVVGP